MRRNMFLLKKTFYIPAAAVLIIISMLFGIPRFKGNSGIKVQAENLMAGVKGENIAVTKDFSKAFIDSTAEFSIEMFKQYAGEENAVYSPTPLYLALGLVLNGAEGETKEELIAALGKYDVTAEELNLYYKSLMAQLEQNTKDTKLNISNSIWYDNHFNVKNRFLETNKTYFNADAYKVDFRAPETPGAINNWVKKATENKIDKMVEEIDPQVVMMLFSSIYFNSSWEQKFIKNNTRVGVFNINDTLKVNTDFMNKKEEMKYINNENEQGVFLPYSGGKFAFMAVMPNETVDMKQYISELNKDSISEKLNSLRTGEVKLSLPKFEIEYGKSLETALKALGIKEMFSRESADLSAMGNSIGNLYVSDVLQKTYIRVDEEGAEAASVVKVEIRTTSVAIDEVSINFNRPFIYAILDTETNLPIFLGIMNNPQKN
jgi:serine protease inhibitor